MPSFSCRHGTCNQILPARGYCASHAHLAPKTDQHYEQFIRNPRLKAFYNGKAWKSTSKRKLALNYICERCNHALAEEAHHIKAVQDIIDSEPKLLYSYSNLMSLCGSCHKVLTGEERRLRGRS